MADRMVSGKQALRQWHATVARMTSFERIYYSKKLVLTIAKKIRCGNMFHYKQPVRLPSPSAVVAGNHDLGERRCGEQLETSTAFCL